MKKKLHYHLNIMNKEKFSVFHVEQNTVQKSCISFHFGKFVPFEKGYTWNFTMIYLILRCPL